MQIYKFGKCYLNTAARRVVRNGEYLNLTPKTFDVLQLLVENYGAIVTKDEFFGKVWKDSFVEEGNLAVYISKLRGLLGETKNVSFIETAHGSGYRFILSVKSVSEDKWKNHLPNKNHQRDTKNNDKKSQKSQKLKETQIFFVNPVPFGSENNLKILYQTKVKCN